MLDRAGGEQFAQRAVLGVDPRVVGEDPPDRDSVVLVEVQGIEDEADDGAGALVVMDLRERQPAVVVDAGVGVVIANALAFLGARP